MQHQQHGIYFVAIIIILAFILTILNTYHTYFDHRFARKLKFVPVSQKVSKKSSVPNRPAKSNQEITIGRQEKDIFVQNLLSVVSKGDKPLDIIKAICHESRNGNFSSVDDSLNASVPLNLLIEIFFMRLPVIRRNVEMITLRDANANTSNVSVFFHFPRNQLQPFSEQQTKITKSTTKTCPVAQRNNLLTLHPSEYFAQNQEDAWLYYHLFYGRTNGIILESGALDGRKFSTSHFFEKHLNWTAIHIEAGASNFKSLIRNRKHSVNIQTALCDKFDVFHYLNLDNSGSDAISGIYEFMTASYIDLFYPYLKNVSINSVLPKLPCVPLKFIFSALGVRHVDLWVLDVEGAEEKVLQGVDFNLVQIDGILVESDQHDIRKNERVVEILSKNGYNCSRKVENNLACVHNSFRPSSFLSHMDSVSTYLNGKSVRSRKRGKKIFYVDHFSLRRFGSYTLYEKYLNAMNGTESIEVLDILLDAFETGAVLTHSDQLQSNRN